MTHPFPKLLSSDLSGGDGQGRVPRHHEPRDPHSAQRHHPDARSVAGFGPASGSDRSGRDRVRLGAPVVAYRSEEHTSELQSLMRISYAVFCLKKKNNNLTTHSIAGTSRK